MSEDSTPTQKAALAIIFLVFSFSLGFSLFINLPVMDQNFLFADQAVYFALTQSIAHDLDLEYTRKDLARDYHDFDAGPQGIFLKKARNGKIFFAKSWAYSLFAAPFVRLFGTNGFDGGQSINTKSNGSARPESRSAMRCSRRGRLTSSTSAPVSSFSDGQRKRFSRSVLSSVSASGTPSMSAS